MCTASLIEKCKIPVVTKAVVNIRRLLEELLCLDKFSSKELCRIFGKAWLDAIHMGWWWPMQCLPCFCKPTQTADIGICTPSQPAHISDYESHDIKKAYSKYLGPASLWRCQTVLGPRWQWLLKKILLAREKTKMWRACLPWEMEAEWRRQRWAGHASAEKWRKNGEDKDLQSMSLLRSGGHSNLAACLVSLAALSNCVVHFWSIQLPHIPPQYCHLCSVQQTPVKSYTTKETSVFAGCVAF